MLSDWAQIGLPCFPLATKRAADRLLSLGTQEAKQKQSRAGYQRHGWAMIRLSSVLPKKSPRRQQHEQESLYNIAEVLDNAQPYRTTRAISNCGLLPTPFHY
ncbi:uncharacterized protein CLUP02_15994 [Colletotrichum lupini]|uniref:Uncharacterized protein n=1 Tax=Colletotrichum lupini TaxID=145971 RepID=A0A9Q8T6Z6_9PEZI|nr:uncharacterized protein CLUP02_15994 [Colletotrichum lupini]UQC90464.1 hypothetical protein CLUP02_15994 [Colletotrichum lupini]